MRVQSLHIYPVKGLPAIDLAASQVEPQGLAHDRRWMLVDADGKFITQREYVAGKLAGLKPAIADNGIAISDGKDTIFIATPPANAPRVQVKIWKHAGEALAAPPEVDAWLQERIGVPCRLVYQGDIPRPTSPDWSKPGDTVSFADGFPLLIVNAASLDDLNAQMAQALPMNRFRANIVVEGVTSWAEDGWKKLKIGAIDIDIAKPCTRCIVTTLDQETGQKTGTEPLDALKKSRLLRTPLLTGIVFGQNAIPRGEGSLLVGDKVEVLETQAPPSFAKTQ